MENTVKIPIVKRKKQMFQNYAKRHSTLLTVKEMLIALGNYFPLIRLAKTQRFNKMLSCFGYEKAKMATHGWWE